jgi:hypothetical protein
MAQNGAFWRRRIRETVELWFERALMVRDLCWILHSLTVSPCFFRVNPVQGGALRRAVQTRASWQAGITEGDGDVFDGQISFAKRLGRLVDCAEWGGNSSQAARTMAFIGNERRANAPEV